METGMVRGHREEQPGNRHERHLPMETTCAGGVVKVKVEDDRRLSPGFQLDSGHPRKKATTLVVAFFVSRIDPRRSVAKGLVPSAARTAASATITTAATGRSTASATISAVRTIAMRTIAAANWCGASLTIEVGLIVGKIAAAFDHH